MTRDELTRLLTSLREGSIPVSDVVEKISFLKFESLGFAEVDHHRALRKGFPEVILCQGKTPKHTAEIASRLAKGGSPLLATRATAEHFAAVRRKVPRAAFHPEAKMITANSPKKPVSGRGTILVITAGTSDIQVAEEAAVTSEVCGNPVERMYDVGVAGLHRLLSKSKSLLRANVIVVAAGMEGALPSVVGGLVDVPVIAVPTSVGYGTSLGGFSALLGMLNSCSSGITVVNIDNGFGAGYAASVINRMIGSTGDHSR